MTNLATQRPCAVCSTKRAVSQIFVKLHSQYAEAPVSKEMFMNGYKLFTESRGLSWALYRPPCAALTVHLCAGSIQPGDLCGEKTKFTMLFETVLKYASEDLSANLTTDQFEQALHQTSNGQILKWTEGALHTVDTIFDSLFFFRNPSFRSVAQDGTTL